MSKRFFSQVSSHSPTPAQDDSNGRETSSKEFEQPVNESKQRSRQNLNLLDESYREGKQRSQPSRPQQVGWELRAKATAIAIALGMLPVLAVGTATYYFGAQVITEQATQARRDGQTGLLEAQLSQQRQMNLLAALTIGTGVTALLSGAIAALFANRAVAAAKTNTAKEISQALVADRAERTRLLTDAVYEIRANLTPANILKTAVEETRRVLACDHVLVYSLDEDMEGTIVAESVLPSFPRALRATVKDPCFGARYIEKYQNGRIHAIDDIYKAKLTACYIEQLEQFAVKANLVAPLLNQGKLIGLLIAHQCSAPRVWQQYEIDLFTQLSTQVGFALDNARLIQERATLEEQINTETEWKELFGDVTRRIHAFLNEEDVLKVAVQEARRVLACDRVVVYSVDRQSQGVVIAESVAPGYPKAFGITIADPCFEARYIEKYENGRVRALNNIYEAGMTQCYIEQLEKLAVKANLVAPVLHEGKLLGLFVAHQCETPRVWQPLEIKWFAQIATQVGFALDNAKLFTRVEQMTKDVEVMALERNREKTALRQQMSALLRDSEAAFEAFSTEASRQAEAVAIAIAQIQAIADSARSTAASAQKAELHVQQATQAVQTGHETVNKTVDSIAALQETVAELSNAMCDLRLRNKFIELKRITVMAIQPEANGMS
jgi:GAF domain-containing protein